MADMHRAPLVTLILTTLNSERYVARSLESCLMQTQQDFELLIVDGGSSDTTLQIVADYQHNDSRIRLIKQHNNSGRLPGALNIGMASARGEYITWTQDDSWFEPNAIEAMLNYLQQNPEVALVYTDFWIVDAAGEPLEYKEAQIATFENMLDADIVGQCFLFRRAVYEILGEQQVKHFPVHEIPWRMRAFERFTIQPLNIPLLYYTYHESSLTGQIGGWRLLRIMENALYEEGYLDKRALRRKLAKIDIDQAYEDYILHGDYPAFWAHALAGIWRHASHLRNRGLLKMMLISLAPGRRRCHEILLGQWRAAQEERLNEIGRKTHA